MTERWHRCIVPPPTRSLVSRRSAVALILGLLIAAFTVAPAAAHGIDPSGVQPRAPECTYTHWAAFNSNHTNGPNGYVNWVYAEGKYDNTSYGFCGYIRGHLSLWIPAYQIGGATSISIASTINYGTAGNAGSSGYWYNLYTSPVSTQCGSAGGTFTPSGTSTHINASTSNACA